MLEYLLIVLLGGVPACIAYAGKGSRGFRSIAGTINLVLAFLLVLVAAVQMADDPPVSTAMASGFAAVVLALAAVALRMSPDSPSAEGGRAQQATAQAVQQPYQGQWAAPHHQGTAAPGQGGAPGMAPSHHGMPPAVPGQGGAPGGAAPQQPQQPQQPWRPSGQ